MPESEVFFCSEVPWFQELALDKSQLMDTGALIALQKS